MEFPAETRRRRGQRREDTGNSWIGFLCAYLCASASLRGRETLSPTVPTRLAGGRRALLPRPRVRRRDPSPGRAAVRPPAFGNDRACASPSPGRQYKGPSRRPPRPRGCRGRASWRATCPRRGKAPPLRGPDARDIFLPAREGDLVRLRRAARAPRAAPASWLYRAPACRNGTSPARTARRRGWRGNAWNRPVRDQGLLPDRRRTGNTSRKEWRVQW